LRISRFSSITLQFSPNLTVSGNLAGKQNLSISEV
jgi:hypothetical protein